MAIELGRAGWLSSLLREVAAGSALPAGFGQAEGGQPGRARARRCLRQGLRECGLDHGVPTGEGTPEETAASAQRAFLAVVRAFTRLGVTLAQCAGLSPLGLADRLLIPFAALAGRLELAEELSRQSLEGRPPTRRQASKVEAALAARAESLSGDPPQGLLLHTGVVQVDGLLFGHLALRAFTGRPLATPLLRAWTEIAALQRSLLVEVGLHLACAERPLADPARLAVLRQIGRLSLPGAREAALKVKVRGGVTAPLQIPEGVGSVRSVAFKRLLLEQVLLASLVDGRRSPGELTFLSRLADALGISAAERARYELELGELYSKHRAMVDVLTSGSGRGEELVDSARASLEKNYRRLLQEARETGELSVLLAKAARGGSLSADERRRMRAQLLDLAKAIPALAIFAAPGGMLLLLALAKVLPFSLLPSAFQDDGER